SRRNFLVVIMAEMAPEKAPVVAERAPSAVEEIPLAAEKMPAAAGPIDQGDTRMCSVYALVSFLDPCLTRKYGRALNKQDAVAVLRDAAKGVGETQGI